VIIEELDKARAAIVIWTSDSIKSQWVRSEARRASLRGVLIPVRDEQLDPNEIPPPFDNFHTDLITNRSAIFAALSRLGVMAAAPGTKSPEAPKAPDSDSAVAEMVAIEHWQAIKATTDPGRLREFLTEFGTSKIARLARDQIASLEETAWRQLPQRRTVDVLNAFLKEFPDGRYAEAAAAAIAELKASHPPKPSAPRAKESAQTQATEHAGRIQLRRAGIASTLGTAIEWDDLFLYSVVTLRVFAKLFFPNSDPLTGTLEAFAIYAVGFVARPLGAAIFGHFGDRIGRKATLIATLLLMGIATFLVSLVPTYEHIGIWGAVILTILRFIQGVGVGGEWGGSVLLSMEWARTNHSRGFIASWPQVGVPCGLLLANLAVLAFSPMSAVR